MLARQLTSWVTLDHSHGLSLGFLTSKVGQLPFVSQSHED